MNFFLILAASVTLAWDASIDALSYNVYVGNQSFKLSQHPPPLVVYPATATQYQVDGLDFGAQYFFVVTALGNGGIESGYSNEVDYTPLMPTPTPTPESIPTPTPEPIPIPEPTVEPLPIPLPTATPILTATPEPTIEPVASATPTPEVFPTPNPSSSRFWFYEAWWRRYFNLPDPNPSPSPN